METYTPVPESSLRHWPHWAWTLVAVSVAIVLCVAAVSALRFMYSTPDPTTFRNFGLVQTSFGAAEVQCGGESATPCSEGTSLRFLTCSERVRQYMTGYYGDAQDARVRDLIHKAPPKGSRWAFYCGWYKYWPSPLATPAVLKSD